MVSGLADLGWSWAYGTSWEPRESREPREGWEIVDVYGLCVDNVWRIYVNIVWIMYVYSGYIGYIIGFIGYVMFFIANYQPPEQRFCPALPGEALGIYGPLVMSTVCY